MNNTKPISLVIFGGTGDLAKNKIFDALFDLYNKKCLPEGSRIIGFSRKDFSDSDYREFVTNALSDRKVSSDFLSLISYVGGDINNPDSYQDLRVILKKLDDEIGMCTNKMYYLATPPNLYENIFDNLGSSDLVTPCDDKEVWTRILVEKPFGSNPEEGMRLDKKLGKMFDESQIFRIDHYLAKEALQNIIFFRFANKIFTPVWNREYVDRVEISLFETNDASDRGHFYDSIGALYDVGQNHILQMLALVTMEDPGDLTADNIRQKRRDAISRIVPFSKKVEEYAYRAQYEGYRDEEGVNPKSDTDTFFQLKLGVNNKRWKGVPFYVQSGKALKEKLVRIKVVFKEEESSVCQLDGTCHYNNEIVIDIQPEEKISVKFWTKKPGLDFGLEQKDLAFSYGPDMELKDAYEKVLFDCIMGDQELFNTTEEVAMQWGLISRVCKDWQNIPLDFYPKGSSAEGLLRLE